MRKNKARLAFGSAILTAAMVVSSVPSFALPVAAVEDTKTGTQSGQLDTPSYTHPVQTVSAQDASREV